MKRLAIVVIIAVILGGIAYSISSTDVYYAEPVVQYETEIEVEQDIIRRAQEELARINVELDEEEKKLLQEIEERKTRIEEIHKTRASFQ